MLITLRREQVAVLEQYMLGRFEDLAVRHASRIFPAKARELGAEGVRTLAKQAIKKARRWGVTQEQDILLFLDLMLGIAPDFDETTPWAREILEYQEISGNERMRRLYGRLEHG